MAVRAKFTVTQIIETRFGPQPEAAYKTVVLEPRYDQTIPEDVRFLLATPSGRMEMRIDNPSALAQFVVGSSFYADFTPVA
jgi:hypothetical protein